MPIFEYRAKKGPEQVVEGTLDAQTEKEAIERLSALGYVPIQLKPQAVSQDKADKEPAKGLGFGHSVKASEITIFSRQLASLLRSGVPILKSLDIIAGQSDNPALKYTVFKIYQAVKEGETFSSALGLFPRSFPPLYIAMVRAGEDSGVLPEVLMRIANYRARQEETLSRIRMALAYPLLMVIVGVGTVVFMLTFVMPRLSRIFLGYGHKLPLPTRILLKVSHILGQFWFWVGFLLLVLFFWLKLRSESSKLPLSRLALKIPLFGKFILKSELGRFCRTMELLLKSGIPILKAISVAYPVVENEMLRESLKASLNELQQGGFLGASLKAAKLFPSFMTNLISVGEESGKLSEAFSEVADSYEQDTEETVRIMTNLLEPLLILIMGLLVGFVVVAMLLPIFEINIMAR